MAKIGKMDKQIICIKPQKLKYLKMVVFNDSLSLYTCLSSGIFQIRVPIHEGLTPPGLNRVVQCLEVNNWVSDRKFYRVIAFKRTALINKARTKANNKLQKSCNWTQCTALAYMDYRTLAVDKLDNFITFQDGR